MIKVWDETQIVALYVDGLSSYRIVEVLDLPITPRQVQRIVQKHGIARARGKNNSKSNQIGSGPLRDIIYQTMLRQGKDPKKCAECGATDRKLDIHHTKYEGATVEDLQFVCRQCNLAPKNMGLD